jgi:hypothetical protein
MLDEQRTTNATKLVRPYQRRVGFLTPPAVALPTLNDKPPICLGSPIKMMAATRFAVAFGIKPVVEFRLTPSGPPQKASSMI